VRSRDCRYLWKAHLLFWCMSGFASGCCIGANAYEETFKVHAVAAPVIMLLPLWIGGFALLKLRGRQMRAEYRSKQSAALLQSRLAAFDTRRRDNGVAAGEYEQLDVRQCVWIAYMCFVAG
jgi:hypothetical protein